MLRSPDGDLRARYRRLARSYARQLFDYAQGWLGDQAASAAVVEYTLSAAAAHFDRVRPERAGETQATAGLVWADPADADSGRPEDPDHIIRPWLYATVRRECVTRQADRAQGVGAGGPGLPVEAAQYAGVFATSSAEGREAVAEALTAEFAAPNLDAEDRRRRAMAVMQVLSGLDDADVEILNLHVRHGLGDNGLSSVFASGPRRAHAQLSAATVKFVQLAATTVLLSAGWSGCRKLDRLVGGAYPSSPDEQLCRRVTRHSKSCSVCGPIVAVRGFGPELLSVLPIPDLPPAVVQLLTSAPLFRSVPAAAPVPQQPGLARATAVPFAPPAAPADARVPGSAGVPADAGVPAGTGLPDRGDVWAGGRGANPGPVLPGPGNQRRDVLAASNHRGLDELAVAGLAIDDAGRENPARAGFRRDDRGRDDRGRDDQGRQDGGQPGPAADSLHGPGRGPRLTRARAGVLAAAAVVIIAGGVVTASKLASSPSGGGPKGSASVTTSQTPTSQPSGTGSAHSAARAHARHSTRSGSTAQGSSSSSAPPGPSGGSSPAAGSSSPTSSPKPKPSSPKPKPSSPKPKPSSSSPSPSPSPSTTSPSPSPTPTITLPTG